MINQEELPDRQNWFIEHIRVLWQGRKNESREKSYLEFVSGFKRLECIKYVAERRDESTTEEDLKCYCGRAQTQHVDLNVLLRFPRDKPFSSISVLPRVPSSASLSTTTTTTTATTRTDKSYDLQSRSTEEEEPWSPKEHLREFLTDSYGNITFESESPDTVLPVQYLRLSNKSQISVQSKTGDPPEVLRLLKCFWYLLEPSKPKLVISITGDTHATGIDAATRERLMQGLINAVKSTNAWLVTDGLDSGYTRLMGKAVGKAQFLHEVEDGSVPQIKCIGVVPYGRLRINGSAPESFQNWGGTLRLKANETEQTPELNGNHTHLLLVDDGFYGEKSNVDNFRSVLLQDIGRKPPKGLGIPVVVTLLEGGFSAIKECLLALRRCIPVMVVKGTGRAADLMSYAIASYTLPMKVYVDGSHPNGQIMLRQEHEGEEIDDIKRQIPKYLPELDEEKRLQCADAVAECCQMGELVTIFNLSSDDSVDKSLLRTLLAGRSSPLGKIELALRWDRVDVAEEKIFPQFESSGGNLGQLGQIMKQALLGQKEDFIELLLQKEVNMSQYLTVYVLRELYRDAETDSHLRLLLQKKARLEGDIFLSHVHCLFEKLIGKHDYSLYESDMGNKSISEEEATFEDPYLELLLWAVVSRRCQLAEYLWKKCKNPLSAALIATCLYHSLKEDKLSSRDTNLVSEFSKMKDTFETRAVQLLDDCYHDDKTKTLRLVNQFSPRWGNLHLMDLALMGRAMRFIASVSCQESMNQRWRNVRSKFYFRLMSRLLVMFLQFYLVLFHLVQSPSSLELLLLCFVVSDALEKGFEAVYAKSMKLWFSAWTIYDIFSQVIFLAGFIFRLFPATFYIGKILYGCSAILFCCRLFRVCYVSNRLGPMILIFIFMLPKLLDFMLFLLVLLVGFGITSKALMQHPCQTTAIFSSAEGSEGLVQFFESIAFNPYWQIFGEFQLDDLEKSKYHICQNMTWTWDWQTSCETCEGPDPSDPSNNCFCQQSNTTEGIAYKLMLALYLIVGNILLLNLIIAIFTNVFQHVQEKSSEHWKFEMYRLTREYDRRPMFPPPFGVFVYFWKLCCSKVNEKLPTKVLDPSSAINSSSQSEASLRIFEQNKAQIKLSNRRTASSDEFAELFQRLTQLEKDMTYIKGEIRAGHEHRQSGLAEEERLRQSNRDINNILAPFEKLQSLPDKINLLEEHLLSSQTRLEKVQVQQGREIKEIRDFLEKLASPFSSSSPPSSFPPSSSPSLPSSAIQKKPAD